MGTAINRCRPARILVAVLVAGLLSLTGLETQPAQAVSHAATISSRSLQQTVDSAEIVLPGTDIEVDIPPVRLIVKFQGGLTAEQRAEILAQCSTFVSGSIDAINISLADVLEMDLLSIVSCLETFPHVEYIELDATMEGHLIPNDELYTSYQYGPQLVGAEQAWNLTTGSSNVTIAIVDSGIDATHPDLQGNVIVGSDHVNGDLDPSDDHGHGTHVAGIAGALINNGTGIAGISEGSKLLAIKVLNSANNGSYSGIAAGVVEAADAGAQIINLSLGGTVASQALEDAVNYAWAQGALIVASAGNFANDTPVYPAAYANVIGVSATDHLDNLWSGSSYGPFVSIAAPGRTIYSTDWVGGAGLYASRSGTSMAAPHVSGTAALMLACDPSLTNVQLRSMLESTALDLGASGPDSQYGVGRLNADAAVAAACADTPTATPTSTSTSTPTAAPTATPTVTPEPTATPIAVDYVLVGGLESGEYTGKGRNRTWSSLSGFNPGDNVYLRAPAVNSDGSPVAGAIVDFIVSKPDGAQSVLQATSNENGIAEVKFNQTSLNGAYGYHVNSMLHVSLSFASTDMAATFTVGNVDVPTATPTATATLTPTASGPTATATPTPTTSGPTPTQTPLAVALRVSLMESGLLSGKGKNKSFTAQTNFALGDRVTLQVYIVDAGNAPLANAQVTLSVTAPNGASSGLQGSSDGSGMAQVHYTSTDGNGLYVAAVDSVSLSGYVLDPSGSQLELPFVVGDEISPTATPTPTSTPSTGEATPTPTPTPGEPTPTPEPTAPPPVSGGNDYVYVSSTSSGKVTGISFGDEDILVQNRHDGVWSLFFDGSDVGIGSSDIDAFAILDDGSILLSVMADFTFPDIGAVDDADIVRFVPLSLGAATSGVYERYFDGSDVGLDTDAEDIHAVHLLPDGRLLLSTLGDFDVGGLSGQREDVLAFSAASLGDNTGGTFALYFDGTAVSLNSPDDEDVAALSLVGTHDIYISSQGAFEVDGISGDGSDIVRCQAGSLGETTACAYSPFWFGADHRMNREDLDAIHVAGQPHPMMGAALTAAGVDDDPRNQIDDYDPNDAPATHFYLPVLVR